ncbi:MAG: protein phosphatase, partial [Gammaproteobacteria bacterium]
MPSTRFEVANLSDTGQKRPHNEDSAVSDANLGLAIVADGMGGYKAGEVASAIAAQLILDEVSTALRGGLAGASAA